MSTSSKAGMPVVEVLLLIIPLLVACGSGVEMMRENHRPRSQAWGQTQETAEPPEPTGDPPNSS